MIRFKDISIRGKLTLLLGVFVGGMLIFGAAAYTAIQTVKVGSALYARIEMSSELNADFTAPAASLDPAAFMLYRIMLSRDQADTQQYLTKFAEMEKTFGERRQYWLANIPEGPMKRALQKTYAGADGYFKITDQEVLPLIRAGKMDQANEVRSAKTLPIYREFEKNLALFVNLTSEDADEVKAEAQLTTRNRITLMVVVLVACLTIAGIIGWYMARLISLGLREKVEILQKVAEGDLTQRIEVDSKDELGQLGQVVNGMTESLSAMIEEISANSKTLASASEELTSTSQQLGSL
jgi:methyl-accepting chemotaxis protein